jgi:redox-sensitive bicupin YhaK (pirin superfamily)
MADHVTLADLPGDRHAAAFEAPRTVHLRLDAGERVAPHAHPGHDIAVAALTGRLEVSLGTGDDEEIDRLAAGDALRFDGDRQVSPAAETAATALVVLAPR